MISTYALFVCLVFNHPPTCHYQMAMPDIATCQHVAALGNAYVKDDPYNVGRSVCMSRETPGWVPVEDR